MRLLRYNSSTGSPLAFFSLAVLLGAFAGESGFPVAESGEIQVPSRPRFASTVQLAIQEPNAQRMKHAQDLVIQEFQKNVQTDPQLRAAHMSVQKTGNEVVISLLTDDDLRMPMRQVLVHMINGLNRRVFVPIRGRTSFYRTSFSEPPEANYTVTVHDPKTRTVYIDAEQAPLIDLLQTLRRKMPNFSYIIPQECAVRRVYFSFGDPDPTKHPPKLELVTAMQGIANMLRVKMDHSNEAFVFSGDCRGPVLDPNAEAQLQEAEWGWPTQILPMRWPNAPTPDRRAVKVLQEAPEGAVAVVAPRRMPPPLLQSNLPAQVYFPVTPIDYEH